MRKGGPTSRPRRQCSTFLHRTRYFSLVGAIAALAATMYAAVEAIVASFSYHRNGHCIFSSGKSGLMTRTPGTMAPGDETRVFPFDATLAIAYVGAAP